MQTTNLITAIRAANIDCLDPKHIPPGRTDLLDVYMLLQPLLATLEEMQTCTNAVELVELSECAIAQAEFVLSDAQRAEVVKLRKTALAQTKRRHLTVVH